jgi:hypothetical protein
MRKLISIVTAIGLFVTISAVQAKASCYSIPALIPINGYTIGGEFCLGQDSLSFMGTATKSGVTYGIMAVGSVTGSGTKLTLNGSVTITQGLKVIKQVSIHENLGNELAVIEAFLQKLLAELP